MPVVGRALVLDYAELDNTITEAEFREWCISQRFRRHQSIAGLHSATLLTKADTQAPSWVAIYDISRPELLQDANSSWHTVHRVQTPLDHAIIARLVGGRIDRRMYTLVYPRVRDEATTTTTNYPHHRIIELVEEPLSPMAPPIVTALNTLGPDTTAVRGATSAFPPSTVIEEPTSIPIEATPRPVSVFMFIIHIEIPISLDTEFSAWCDTEHMPIVQEFEGWVGGRRYKRMPDPLDVHVGGSKAVASDSSLKYKKGTKAAAAVAAARVETLEYLIIHELGASGLLALSRYWDHKSTRRQEIMAQVVKKEVRLFEKCS